MNYIQEQFLQILYLSIDSRCHIFDFQFKNRVILTNSRASFLYDIRKGRGGDRANGKGRKKREWRQKRARRKKKKEKKSRTQVGVGFVCNTRGANATTSPSLPLRSSAITRSASRRERGEGGYYHPLDFGSTAAAVLCRVCKSKSLASGTEIEIGK